MNDPSNTEPRIRPHTSASASIFSILSSMRSNASRAPEEEVLDSMSLILVETCGAHQCAAAMCKREDMKAQHLGGLSACFELIFLGPGLRDLGLELDEKMELDWWLNNQKKLDQKSFSEPAAFLRTDSIQLRLEF
jgi:hypothetical protein